VQEDRRKQRPPGTVSEQEQIAEAEAVYRPSDTLKKRRKLGKARSAYCEQANVASNVGGKQTAQTTGCRCPA
jgi:hypothetical protein